MLPAQLPVVRRPPAVAGIYQVVLAVLLAIVPLAGGAVRYNVDFEEPAHHLNELPSTGGAPDKITSMVGIGPGYGGSTVVPPLTIVTAPRTLRGQALWMPTGYPHTFPAPRTITLAAPEGLKPNFSVHFDMISPPMAAVFECTVAGNRVSFNYPNVLWVDGPQTPAKSVTTYSNDAVYHVSIDFSAELGLWIGRFNGREVWREPYEPTQAPNLVFHAFTPFAGQTGYHSLYIDNIVVADTEFNQTPSFTPGGDVVVAVDTPYQKPWATNITAGANEPYQQAFFEVATDRPELFGIHPMILANGDLFFMPASKATGHAKVYVRLVDTGGTADGAINSTAYQTFSIDITAVDDPPTIASLPDLVMLPDSPEQTVALSGITAGASGQQAALRVTATSSNPAVIPTPSVIYASPETTGNLKLTPAAGASGAAIIEVTVEEVDSPAVRFSRSFTVQVTDGPTFAKGPDVTVLEDRGGTYRGWARNISIGSASPQEPIAFEVSTDNPALFAAGPAISTAGDFSFSGAPDIAGVAIATVRLRAGSKVSEPQTFTIKLTPLNDPPTITAPAELTLPNDGQAHRIELTDITPGGPNETDEISATASVRRAAGTSDVLLSAWIEYKAPSTTGTLVIRPDSAKVGTQYVNVVVQETAGDRLATYRYIKVNVEALPRAPVFTAGSNVTVIQDSGAARRPWASGLRNSYGFATTESLEFLVQNNKAALFAEAPAISPTGVLTFRPAAGANGTAEVSVTLRDNSQPVGGEFSVSATKTFTITVTPPVPPKFTPGADVSTGKNVPVSSSPWAKEIRNSQGTSSTDALEFLVENDNPALFKRAPAINPNGLLSFQPADQMTGFAQVSVTLRDNSQPAGSASSVSATVQFSITVFGGNAPGRPVFTAGTNLSLQEDSGPYSATWATRILTNTSSTSASWHLVNFLVVSDAPGLFLQQPTISREGVLEFTPAENAFGTANVSVTLQDNSQTEASGFRDSVTKQFTITLGPVNDPPSFLAGGAVKVKSNAGAQTTSGWARQIRSGPPNEVGQTVHFVVTVDQPGLFSVQPAISADGTLTVTPAAEASGIAQLSVRLADSEGGQSASVTTRIEIGSFEPVAGIYRALVQAPAPNATLHKHAGMVNLTVSRSGQFTGRILLHQGQARPLMGRFDSTGKAVFNPGAKPQLRLALQGLPALDLQFELSTVQRGSKLTGTLLEGATPYAEISGALAVFVATSTPTPPFQALPAELRGRYTVALLPPPSSAENPNPPYPRGAGVATLTLNRSGQLLLVGQMSDGSPLGYSGPLFGDLTWPLYIPTHGGRGSLSGHVRFRDRPEVSDLDSDALHWSSPGSRTRPASWDGVPVQLIGAKYSGAGFAGLRDASEVNYSAQITLKRGSETSTTRPLSITSGVTPSSTDPNFVVKILAESGYVQGSFRYDNTDNRNGFRGIILSKQSSAYGYFDNDASGSIAIMPAQN